MTSWQSAAEDEAEDGALEEADYAVGEEEVMQDANLEAQQEDASQSNRPANGTVQHQPDSAEEDRYVATAYSEGEDQDERCALHLPSAVYITLLTGGLTSSEQQLPEMQWCLGLCKLPQCTMHIILHPRVLLIGRHQPSSIHSTCCECRSFACVTSCYQLAFISLGNVKQLHSL